MVVSKGLPPVQGISVDPMVSIPPRIGIVMVFTIACLCASFGLLLAFVAVGSGGGSGAMGLLGVFDMMELLLAHYHRQQGCVY